MNSVFVRKCPTLPSSYPLTSLEGLVPDAAAALKKAGIRTTARLLDAAKRPKDRKALAEKTGISEKQILSWANMADRMRVPGLGPEYALLLCAAGVDTVKELKYRNPENLVRAMADQNRKRKLVRILPSERAVGRWIEHARKLPLKISY
ncbi:MAG: DUF4332 domain-containing protein [Pseudorhodoplanes sp.]|nr:MAG: DUF4332 domain-containing protein [Pseudorhodoplanes sp.]